ncbi:energy transducer TonB [Vogesella sp. GCM10023246]|uniref:Protein TonB n=1 Tax=Vogesella oryzagri TaxID=3160864 RepID=A0ABV1M9F9_9NEIS
MRLALLLSLLLHALLLAALARTLWLPLTPAAPLVLELRLATAASGGAAKGRAGGAPPVTARAAVQPREAVRPTPAPLQPSRPAVVAGAVSTRQPAAPASTAPTAAAAPSAPVAQTEGAAGGPQHGAPPAGDMRKARLVSAPRPAYPPLSRELNEAGVVWLRLTVDEQGTVSNVQLLRSSGFRRLDKAAMAVVWQWRFLPQLEAGKVVVADIEQPVRFNLQESE